MSQPLRRAAVTAAFLAVLLGLPTPGALADHVTDHTAGRTADHTAGHAPAAADLPRLQAKLARVTAQAQRLGDQLQQAASRDGGLRVAVERLAEQHNAAQAQLDARARLVYMRTAPDPLASISQGLAGPGLRWLAVRGSTAALTVDRRLVLAVTDQSTAVRALRARALTFRTGLRVQAAAVLAAQDTARLLLAHAEQLVAEQAARDQRAAEQAALLAAERAALDQISATVTLALTPAQTTRSRRAASDESPLIAAVESAGAGYPVGYRPTGQTLSGTASWYGPGFVGSPTASGAPYDPERLTCANKEVPLGTVLRVSANGRAISCLVNDRGPYVGDRILDLSRAGSRALGYDGLAQVVIEVLAPA